MKTSRRLLGYFLPYWKRILAGIVATMLVGFCETIFASGCGILVDGLTTISANIKNGRGIFAAITIVNQRIKIFDITISGYNEALMFVFLFGLVVFGLVVFKGFFVYGKEYLMASVSQKVLRTMRNKIYGHVVYLPMHFFDREKTGATMNRITYDVSNIEYCFSSGISLVQSVVFTIVFLGYMFFIQWELTLFAVIMFPIAGYIIKYFSIRFRAVNKRITEHLAIVNSYILEALSSIKIVKSYTKEDYEKKKFHDKMNKHYDFSMRSVRLTSFLKPINEILSLGGMILIIGFAGYRMINGQMNMGDVTAFLVLLTMAYKPVKGLGDTPNVIQRALASADNIFSILDRQPELRPGFNGKIEIEKIKGEVIFEDVQFSYNGEDIVLKDLSFKVKSGEAVALVGPSGAGKSTIINLILKFYLPNKGKILIDGINILDITIKSVRSQIGIVPQETILFSGTIFENIRYGNLDATDLEVINAAKAANAHIFIKNLPNGYQTEIGERGVKLSGGERQRISIARAILSNPRILVLDEATSSLDSESENLVKEATENLMRNRTSFVIAHRLSTIQNADKILVVNEGKIVQSGNHQDLMNQEGLYKNLYQQQFHSFSV